MGTIHYKFQMGTFFMDVFSANFSLTSIFEESVFESIDYLRTSLRGALLSVIDKGTEEGVCDENSLSDEDIELIIDDLINGIEKDYSTGLFRLGYGLGEYFIKTEIFKQGDNSD